MKLYNRQGQVNEIRKNDQVPGVIYGHGIDPTPVQVDYQELRKALANYGTSMTFEVSLGKKKHLVYIKDYQSDYIHNYRTIHVDFMKVSSTDTISTSVHLNFLNKGEVAGTGQVVSTNLQELDIEYKVGKGVSSIDVDLKVLQEKDAIHVSDIVVPEGIKVLNDPTQLVANIAAVQEEKPEVEETDDMAVVYAEETEE